MYTVGCLVILLFIVRKFEVMWNYVRYNIMISSILLLSMLSGGIIVVSVALEKFANGIS